MTTFEWFHQKRTVVYPLIDAELNKKYQKLQTEKPTIQEDVRTVIQTVGVCYYASLDDRGQFLEELANCFNHPGIDATAISMELICCQAVFLRNIQVGNNIACNQALRENVFMMAVCMDMRIPLFLIGKPGSSKSLAKTIIQNNMLGEDSHATLYQNLKKVGRVTSFWYDATPLQGLPVLPALSCKFIPKYCLLCNHNCARAIFPH